MRAATNRQLLEITRALSVYHVFSYILGSIDMFRDEEEREGEKALFIMRSVRELLKRLIADNR